jgi:hypothetical protein
MIFKIIFTPDAENDIQNASDYYFNRVSQKVGLSFFTDLNSSLDSIEQNPYYQTRVKNFRALPLKKFPYILFFELFEENKIVKVIALFNTYQTPEKYPS